MRLIINADDFGMTKSINEAIIELAELGSISSTSVMVNMPFAEDVVKLNTIGIGLHVNLTQGKPVLQPDLISSIVDKNGVFYDKPELLSLLQSKKISPEHIYLEIEAQYRKLKEIYNGQITHVDSHQGVNKLPLVINSLVRLSNQFDRKLSLRYYKKIYIREHTDHFTLIKPSLEMIPYLGFVRIIKEIYISNKAKKLSKHFNIPDGLLLTKSHNINDVFQALIKFNQKSFLSKDDLLVEIGCHPATNILDLKSTSLTNERVKEYQTLRSESFITTIKELNLISYPITN